MRLLYSLYIARSLPYMYIHNLYCVDSSLQGTFAGILRGCGRQKLGAIMNFVFYYMIGLPMGTSLAVLTDLGTTGMWIGLCVAVFLTVSDSSSGISSYS